MKPLSYTKIALDMAKRIEQNEFYEGQKLHGRSILASYYCVSPETIRKAMSLLSNMGIVEIKQSSGIWVVSKALAKTYIDAYDTIKSARELKEQIVSLMGERKRIDNEILSAVDQLSDCVHTMTLSSAIHPIEIDLPVGSICAEKRIKEISFWENTGGTIVGVRRDADFLLSPGPDFTLNAGDVLVVIGGWGVHERATAYVQGTI